MKVRQFIRKLRKAGVTIVPSRGKGGGHWGAVYNGRKTVVPYHGDQDLAPTLMRDVCKQLGLDFNAL